MYEIAKSDLPSVSVPRRYVRTSTRYVYHTSNVAIQMGTVYFKPSRPKKWFNADKQCLCDVRKVVMIMQWVELIKILISREFLEMRFVRHTTLFTPIFGSLVRSIRRLINQTNQTFQNWSLLKDVRFSWIHWASKNITFFFRRSESFLPEISCYSLASFSSDWFVVEIRFKSYSET